MGDGRCLTSKCRGRGPGVLPALRTPLVVSMRSCGYHGSDVMAVTVIQCGLHATTSSVHASGMYG